jgi:DNA-binding MarR family transcriptional regulator
MLHNNRRSTTPCCQAVPQHAFEDGSATIPVMPRTAPTTQHFERRVDGIEYGILDTLVGYAIRRAQITIYEDFDRALAAVDVTPQRFAALVLIGENPGIPQHLLGRVLGIARSGVVQIVHGFVERGWAVRATDGADARSKRLTLTAEGRTLLVRARRLVRAHDRRVSRMFDADARERLIATLDRLGPAARKSRGPDR